MREFTAEDISKYRKIINDWVGHLPSKEAEPLVGTAPVANEPVKQPEPTSIFRRLRASIVGAMAGSSVSAPGAPEISAKNRHISLNRQLDQDPLAGNYTLVRFLTEIYKHTTSIGSFLTRVDTLNNTALIFFLQAEPKGSRTTEEQEIVNANCRAKLALISQGKIRWEHVRSIKTLHHPLLNPQAILRMAADNGTTLEEEFAALQSRKDSELLLGDIFEQALLVELDRLSKLYPILENANNKASKLSHWLRAAQQQYPIEVNTGRLAKHHKFAFYKTFLGEKGTDKNIEEVLSQKRYGVVDAKDSHSYDKIMKIKALLNAYQAELHQESAYALLPKFAAELALASISLMQNPEERSEALVAFRAKHPHFHLAYVQSTTGFVFESGSLATLLNTLHESEDYKKTFYEQLRSLFGKASESKPEITWQQIKQEILAYQARKIEKHSRRPSVSESHLGNNAGEQSRRPSLVGDNTLIKASVKGRRPSLISGGNSSLVQELNHCFDHNDTTALTTSEKEDIIVKIYRHITGLGFNKQGKELSESGLMAANLLNLLYGFNSHPVEMLEFLKGFSGEEELRHSVRAHFTLTLEQQLNSIKIDDTETDIESATPPADHAAVVASQQALSLNASNIELKVAAVPAPVENP